VIFERGWSRASRLSNMLKRAGTDERLESIVRTAASTMHLAKTPEVLVVDGHLSPLLWVGRRGPIIVLPAQLVEELNDDELLDVVRHELAHYVRRDHWWNGLAFVITALWWWDPVAWWARRRLLAAQELCCDAMAIDGSPATRRRYAETLLKVLEFLESGPPVIPALGAGFRGGHPVRKRFEMIADAKLSHRWSRRAVLVVICGTALLPCVPTMRAQEDPDDSRPAESGANDHHDRSRRSAIDAGAAAAGDHHDPSQHAAVGDAAFVREVIGRYDPDFWREEDTIRELHRAGLAVPSPQRNWLAMIRDGALVVIEVRTGHVALREQLEEVPEQIEWTPGGVRVATADGGELRFDVTPQVIRLLDARGRVETVNSVVTAEVGYSDRLPAWSTWPTPDGEISLAGLPAGEHWLVTTPTYLDVLRVRVPGDEPLIERRQRAPTTNRSKNVNDRLSVRWDDEAGDILRIEVENRTGDVFRFSERDLLLEAGTRRHSSHFVLSPWWVSDQSEPVSEVVIEDGQTGAMEISWRDWVRDGLWVSRYGAVLAEPSLPEPVPGRMFVRLRGPYFGSLPVDVTHPMNERNAPLQGTWRLINTETVGVEIAPETMPYDPEVSKQPHMRMLIDRQMISGMPVVPAETPVRLHPSGIGMLTDPEVQGMYSLNDTASPKTLAVERHRRTGTRIETEFRACLYRIEEAAAPADGRVLVLAFNPEHPDKPPAAWDREPLAIYRFHQSERPENADDNAGADETSLRDSTQFLLHDARGAAIELRSTDGELMLRFPGRLNLEVDADGSATSRFTMTAIPDHPGLTLHGSLECVPRTPETTRFLKDNAITVRFEEADIDLAVRSVLTKYIFLPHRQPDEKWSGYLGHLDMAAVAADQHAVVMENLKRRGHVLAVLRLGTRDPDDAATAQSPPDHTTAGPDEPPDITFKDSEVTGEAIGQLAGRDWGTVTLRGAQFDGEIIERLRHAGSIHTLRLYGEGLSGQLPRLEHVRGLVDLEIGAPLNGRDLEAIGRLTQLERLKLPQEMALTVTGAQAIAHLTNLQSLGLYNVDVDDASFAELATLVNLEEIDLSHTRITDEGLRVLAGMPRLRSLDLRRHPDWYIAQQISDACVPVLCELPRLESLSLSGNITDAGLARIAELPELRSLSIVNTRITGEGLAALEDSHEEYLALEPGQVGGLPPGIIKDEDILRFMPGLSNIRKCRNLKAVWVIGEPVPEDEAAWQRLAPNVDWGFES
jgi:hypothetical protein